MTEYLTLVTYCYSAVQNCTSLLSQGKEKMVKEGLQTKVKTREIASLRMHVERAIQRMKTFRILTRQIGFHL